MIVAEIYTHSDGKIAAFVFSGHSGGASHGYNIHCAEVSMLSQTAFLGIRQYLNRDVAIENFEHGGLGVELKNPPDELTEAVLQTMLIGLRKIKKIAPKDLKLKIIPLNTAAEKNLQSKINGMKPSANQPLPKVEVEDVRIRADIFRNDDGKITGFSVEERDTDNPKEFAIYRESIWILVRSSFYCVKDFLKRDLEFKWKSRRLTMTLKTSPDELTETVFQTMIIGLREVEKLVPQIVKVTEKTSTEVTNNGIQI